MINFDATKYDPTQGTAKHPVGSKFPAIISEVKVDGKSQNDHHIIVFFTTQSGSIRKQYNIATESTEANMMKMAEIARSNLAALCHATGVFKLPTGQELVNARCQIDVTPQTKNPEYNEVSKVYDANGNEPGKAPAAAPQPATAQGGWNNQPSPQPAAQAAQQGWAPNQPVQQNNAPPPTPAPANNPGWQQGPSAPVGAPPPWATGR